MALVSHEGVAGSVTDILGTKRKPLEPGSFRFQPTRVLDGVAEVSC